MLTAGFPTALLTFFNVCTALLCMTVLFIGKDNVLLARVGESSFFLWLLVYTAFLPHLMM